MDHPFTEQCFYSNCLCYQTNITIINLHTFVLDKVRVRELCCPLLSHKLMIKSHACVVLENTHTQEGFIGLIPLPSPPLSKFKIRCIELTFALTFNMSNMWKSFYSVSKHLEDDSAKLSCTSSFQPKHFAVNIFGLLYAIHYLRFVAAGDLISSESHASHAPCSKMVASYSFILW